MMAGHNPSILRQVHSAQEDTSAFPVLVILVPARGLNPVTLTELCNVPEGAALIMVECPGTNAEPGVFSARLETLLVGRAGRRSANLVRDGMQLEQDQVYIVPAGLYPEVRDGRFIILNRPFRDGESCLPDFILSGFANNFRNHLTVILTDQTGLLGAEVVRREGGFVYFLDDHQYRVPRTAADLVDGVVDLHELGVVLCPERRKRKDDTGKSNGRQLQPLFKDRLPKLLDQEIFPRLIKDRQERGPIRVWIAANPDGMTTFSTAICLSEYLRARKIYSRIQVFATGLNRREVHQSRLGVFEGERLASFRDSLREQYFTRREDGRYQVSRDLQRSCIFAAHHLIGDPPFSHCDLVICADSLDLLSDAQRKKAFANLHYAINPGGCLLMLDHAPGTALPPPALFDQLDTVPGIYIRKSDAPVEMQPAPQSKGYSDAEKEVEKIFLSGYVPAGMLVDDELRVIRFYGVMSPYLRRQQDRPSLQLLKIVRDELLFDLSELLEKVAKTHQPAAADSVWLADESRPECRVEVIPIAGTPRDHKLIIIREKEGASARTLAKPRSANDDTRDKRIRSLERQVQRLRYQLQAAHHLFRANQEDLQSANEEMVANNEELQSVNEEFHSLNDDLNVRNRDLEQQAYQSRSVISAIHRPLLVILDSGEVHIANRAFLELFGLQRRSIEGQPWTAAAGAMFDLPELRDHLQSLAKADVVEFELKHRFPGLDEKALAFTANRIKGDSASRGGILLMVEDVTDRRQVERFKDEFIGIASHELKTPATSIKAYTQLLRRELVESDKGEPAKLAEHLSQQVDRLTDLAKDLLDITKASGGQLSLKRGYFAADRLVQEVIEDMQPTTTARIVLNENTASEIWADRERIRQVLVNLLSNAIKYSPDHSDIIIRSTVIRKKFQLTVQDFGIGMTDLTLQRLFNRYYRAEDNSNANTPGMGLGLYIAAEIVRRHGGSIMASSEFGKGSIFTVQIPIEQRNF